MSSCYFEWSNESILSRIWLLARSELWATHVCPPCWNRNIDTGRMFTSITGSKEQIILVSKLEDCMCRHLHCCEVFKICEELENEIMNGTQGDHVAFVTWRRRKQLLSIFTHFIHLLNTTLPMPSTDIHSGAPMSHFINRRVGMDCQALNFQSWANHVTIYLKCHKCMHICKM